MKNIKTSFVLIISVLFISICGFSQSLTISWDGEPVADTMLVIGAATDFEIVAHAIITNESDHSMDVKVRRDQLQMIEGTMSQFCWGANCYPPNVEESPGFLTLEPGQSTEEAQFSGHYLPQGHNGDSFIEYKFFNMNNEDENAKVIVQFAATAVGVIENDLSVNIYPNPASGHLTINMPQSIEAISIYDFTGARVMEMQIKSNSCKLSTSYLSSGVYLLRIKTHSSVITKQVVIN